METISRGWLRELKREAVFFYFFTEYAQQHVNGNIGDHWEFRIGQKLEYLLNINVAIVEN